MKPVVSLHSGEEPGFDTVYPDTRSPALNQVETPPKFLKPQLPDTKRNSLQEDTRPDQPKVIVRLGIVMEEESPEILSEVTRDLISLVGSLPANYHLVVTSPSSSDFWGRVQKVLPLSVQIGAFDQVKTWKVYWTRTKPQPPEGVRYSFEKRLGTPELKKLRMRPGPESTLPQNKDANRMLPLGLNPAFRHPPARAPVQMTPQLYLWSSGIPILTAE